MSTELAAYIDHTLLRPDATAGDIDRLCDEARTHGFVAVCVNSYWVARAASRLADGDVKVASVVAFPFGAVPTDVKVAEARRAIEDGADELDMVVNIGALRDGDHDAVRADVAAVADVCRSADAVLKVILETAYLDDEQKAMAARLAVDGGADFVKTSTGYASAGATVEDVRLLREVVGPDVGVKASGGVRTADQVREMLAAGATRIGASAGVRIVGGEPSPSEPSAPDAY